MSRTRPSLVQPAYESAQFAVDNEFDDDYRPGPGKRSRKARNPSGSSDPNYTPADDTALLESVEKHFDGKAPTLQASDAHLWKLVMADVPRVINRASGYGHWNILKKEDTEGAAPAVGGHAGEEEEDEIGEGMEEELAGFDAVYEKKKSVTTDKLVRDAKQGMKLMVAKEESESDEVIKGRGESAIFSSARLEEADYFLTKDNKKTQGAKKKPLVEKNSSSAAPSPKRAKVDNEGSSGPSLFAAIAGVMKLAEGGDVATRKAAEQFAEKLAAGWSGRKTE